MGIVKKLALSTGIFAAAFALMASPAFAASTVVVTGDTSEGYNQSGWLFNRDQDTKTPYEFTTDEASIGQGSIFVKPIGGENRKDKFIAEYFYQDSVESFESVAYDFQIAGDGTDDDSEQYYLNVYTNLPKTDPNKYYDCKYDYAPVVGSTDEFTTFDVDKNRSPARVQANNGADCPATLGELPEGSALRAFSINVGDTSTNDEGLAGYLDNVVLNANGEETIFDFEPALTPASKQECKDGGWQTFNTPEFKNQGQCVSFVASEGRSQRQ